MRYLILLLICATAQASDAVWKVRDVSSHGSFVIDHPTLKIEQQTAGDRSTGIVIDTIRGGRAATLAWCMQRDAIGGTWFDDPQSSRKITAVATQPYANLTDRAGGMMDEASLYP